MELLLVDDSASARRNIRAIASRVATTIHECSDGDEAKAAYVEWRPDYVLMDLNMARVDGLAATKQILAFDKNAKVIIVTNHDEPDLREACRAAGAYGYVVKKDLVQLLPLLMTQ